MNLSSVFRRTALVLAVLFFVIPAPLPAQKALKPVPGIGEQEYRDRRQRVIAMLDSGSILVMKAFDARLRSNDVTYRYRQESNFLYLTGLNESATYLIMTPRGVSVDGTKRSILLFVPSSHELLSRPAEGGPEAVVSTDRFKDLLDSSLKDITTVYFSAPDLAFKNDWLNGRALFIDRDARKQFEEAHDGTKLKPAATLVAAARVIKSETEIGLIQHAIDMTGAGIRRAMKICRPGTWEYELQAEIEYEMTRNGADYQSFPSIIGSGLNSLILHYDDNTRETKKGDLVVMDVGAEYKGYAADITRTIPVSGKYTKAQKEVYEVVLQAQKEAIKLVRPGASIGELDARAREVITQAGYGEFILHSISHHLGVDVHDAAPSSRLKPGMVITMEPGIYIPADAQSVKPEYRGFGIRIEDDVLVTEAGCKVLSAGIPKEVAEIEAIMKH